MTDLQPRADATTTDSDAAAGLGPTNRDADAARRAAMQGVERRGLIPTAREAELGAHADDYDFVDPAGHGPADRLPLSKAVKSWARDADPRSIEGPMMPIAVLAGMALLSGWDDLALGILLPEIRAEFGISVARIGAIGTQVLLVVTLLGPLMGYLADRVKRVWMVRIGAITSNVASIFAGTSGSVGQFIGARYLNGLGSGFAQPASFPLLTDYYPVKARARVFAFVFAVGAFGGIIGPSIAGNLAAWYGWRSAIIALGVLATVVSFATFLLREPVRGMQDRLDLGVDEEQAGQEQEPVSFAEGWRAARSITTVRRFMYASPILYIGSAGTSIILGFYFAEVFGLDARQRGYLGTFGGVIGLVALVFSGPLTDRLLRDRPGRVISYLGSVVVVQATCFVALAYSPNLYLSLALTLPVSFGAALLTPAFITVMSLVVPARFRGFGLQSFAWFTLIGIVAFPQMLAFSDSLGIRKGLLVFVPFLVVGGLIIASAGSGVARDIRAAEAASAADRTAAEARRDGRNKMLICRDVDVEYSGVQVLFNVDFDVEEGEIVALLGTNGAGKSTLLRAICGVQEASNGAIFLDGHDITHSPPNENAGRGVVMMPGGHATFPALSVGDNLRTAAWIYRDDEEEVAARTEQVLEMFPVLRERLDQQAGNLSGGEQQMVGLAQAFLMNPRLLMIDELSLGLAPAIVDQLLDVLRKIHAEGTTVILVEQSLNVALTIAKRAVFMEKGEIRFDGATSELLARPELVRSVFMGGASAGSTGRRRRSSFDEDAPAAIAIDEVSASFGGVQALHRVSFSVAPNEIVGIIGPNGAGKTTLFDVISGFVRPDAGAIVLEGNDVSGLVPDARARLGLGRSFQTARLFPSLTVSENIAVALERKASKNPLLAAAWAAPVRRSETTIYRRVDGLIELLGLDAFADKYVGELSTGSRRAVDVACIMAAEPKVLLLDEPAAGLAQAETEELGPVITRIVRETGAACLVIEHDLPLITAVSDRLVAMELGRVVAIGEPSDVVNDPAVLRSYLSASESVIERSDTMAAVASALGQDVNGDHENENPTT